jgi:hypothetical protein
VQAHHHLIHFLLIGFEQVGIGTVFVGLLFIIIGIGTATHFDAICANQSMAIVDVSASCPFFLGINVLRTRSGAGR